MAKRTKFTIILPDRKDDAESIAIYGDNVYAGMSNNVSTFPSPSPDLKALQEATIALRAKIVPERLRNTDSNEKLQQQIDLYLPILGILAGYVIMMSNGDRLKASLSGFKLSKAETEKKTQSAPEIRDATPGAEKGTVRVRIKNRGNNDFFVLELVEKTSGESGEEKETLRFLDAFSSQLFTLKGLPSGSSTVRITGKKGDVPSDPVDFIVKSL